MTRDLIAADEDELVAIPAADAAAVIVAVGRHAASEATMTAAIRRAGQDRDWVVGTLRAKGTEGA